MRAIKLLCTMVIIIVCCTLCLIFYSCTIPTDPYIDPNSVSIDLILPNTTSHIIYTKEIEKITITTFLPALVDSVQLTVGTHDSAFTTISDTISVKWIFTDTGNIPIVATAYCKQRVIKFCKKMLSVHKNPLAPPDSVHLQSQTDSSIILSWKKVTIAKKYLIYQSLSDTGTFSLLQTVVDSFYVNTSLNTKTTYYYKISIIDSLNRESDQSSIYSAKTNMMLLQKWDELIWDQNKWE